MLFVPKCKPLLINKGNKSLNIRHPRLIHVIALSAALPLAPIMLPSYQNLNFQNLGIYFYAWTILCYVCLLFFTCLTFKLAILFQLTSKPLHLRCTYHLQYQQRMEFLPTPFLQTAQGNLFSSVTLPTSSLLIFVFVFLTSALNPFDSNTPLEAFQCPFQFLKCFTN